MAEEAAEETKAPTYDVDNVFAKILDGKLPSFKVYESKTVLAILDAYPVCEGHTLVIPKKKKQTDFLSMPAAAAGEYMVEVYKVARAVKAAFKCDGVSVISNNGEAAGQVVPHPHFHIIPRSAGDNLITLPKSAKEMISAEAAKPLQEKMVATLNPPKPLRKAKFNKVGSIKPSSTGLNLLMKVVGEPKEVEAKIGKFTEVLCADASGSVVLSLRDVQKDIVTKGSTIVVRNATPKMISGCIRLTVNKWGKIEASEEALEGEPEMDEAKNVSATEYELV